MKPKTWALTVFFWAGVSAFVLGIVAAFYLSWSCFGREVSRATCVAWFPVWVWAGLGGLLVMAASVGVRAYLNGDARKSLSDTGVKG